MRKLKKLSNRQKQIYDYIVSFVDEHGYPPAVREIGEAVNLKSPSTVHLHLKTLHNAGLINKDDNKTRAISLSGTSWQAGKVPVLGTVRAGAPITAFEDIVDFLPYDTGGAPGDFFALNVCGDSMINAGIMDGDRVVVRKQQTARSGEIIVALIEDEATVKRLYQSEDKILLLPENDEYEPIDGKNAAILGKVTAVIREY